MGLFSCFGCKSQQPSSEEQEQIVKISEPIPSNRIYVVATATFDAQQETSTSSDQLASQPTSASSTPHSRSDTIVAASEDGESYCFVIDPSSKNVTGVLPSTIYNDDKPIKLCNVPYEERVAKLLLQEQKALEKLRNSQEQVNFKAAIKCT